MRHLIACLALAAAPVFAADLQGVDVVFLGEQHDNPHHHARQAELTADLSPKALVFEMLTAEQATQVTPDLIGDEAALEAALGWNDSGWPDFSMYYPIFAAAPQARVYGAAVPRDAARAAMSDVVAAFDGDAAAFGLDQPLPEDQQAAREELQQAAHCNALPPEMLPMMVSVQRLRDAELARQAKLAYQATGGPVVVITGNGHAREDWGAPVALAAAAPDLTIAALGQGEDDRDPEGRFDTVAHSPSIEREDPCEAFLKSRGN
ncbi:ChaN family lipoprotein [Mesobacterium sp. TK19101]|uniref:ChaN family lipoprotein n=1 Tax=Mesobacterium hydrothermale TaxID=3111907 RepID=A0ABU6HER4_9RHOB|nr:ChaN family lipoprotein [Mesobacterium sp. TK19101]MEC3860786.1 ChaN family lipoprotein [Mesobacterium sp. TK19101]